MNEPKGYKGGPLYPGQQHTYNSLVKVFGNMASDGYVVRKAWMCCEQCAADHIEKEVQQGKMNRVRGIVFWTQDDGKVFCHHKNLIQGARFMTIRAFGLDDSDVSVKEDLLYRLKNMGVKVEWNGNPKEDVVITFWPG